MVATTPLVRPQQRRVTTAPNPRLRVVGADDTISSIGRIGSLIGAIAFVGLLGIAALHAVLVQTQAEIDAQRSENAVLQEQVDQSVVTLAWIDSPEGLETWARDHGLVVAEETRPLAPVNEGALPAPASANPFGPTSGAVG
jgi:hypothetical protein